MIETMVLSIWASLVESVALIAIIVLAFGVIVRAVAPGDVMRRLGMIIGIVILLLMMPVIIASQWNSMSFGQHLGIIAVLGILGVIVFRRGAYRKGDKLRGQR